VSGFAVHRVSESTTAAVSIPHDFRCEHSREAQMSSNTLEQPITRICQSCGMPLRQSSDSGTDEQHEARLLMSRTLPGL